MAAACARVAVLMTGCSKGATANGTATSTTATPSAPTTTAAPSTTTTTQPVTVGAVGYWTMTDQSGNKFDVWVLKVTDPAAPAQYVPVHHGQRFVGVYLKIKGMSGSYSDDANGSTVLIGSNQQTYQALRV